MAYSLNFTMALGSSQTGLTLKAALIDDATDALTVKDLTAGFFEIGNGFYKWKYAAVPDNYQGSAVFYVGTIGGGTDFSTVAVKAAASINLSDGIGRARGEPGPGNPPVSADSATKQDYLYKAWRNKNDQTNAAQQLYADDGVTVDQKRTTSDDGDTLTVGEVVTGP